MQELIEKGEDLILRSKDPAIKKVKGHRRFLVGLDIAQGIDRTAFSIILDESVPSKDRLLPRRREIVRADHIPSMSYADLAVVVKNLMADKSLVGRSHLAVDASGVGRAFCDILQTKDVPHVRVQMTGGESESETKEKGRTFSNVGKARLLSALNSALHTGDLKVGNFASRDLLRQELESFEADITKAGRLVIEGGTSFGHGDLAVASCLAYWLSDHRSVGAFIGETPLRGYWG